MLVSRLTGTNGADRVVRFGLFTSKRFLQMTVIYQTTITHRRLRDDGAGKANADHLPRGARRISKSTALFTTTASLLARCSRGQSCSGEQRYR